MCTKATETNNKSNLRHKIPEAFQTTTNKAIILLSVLIRNSKGNSMTKKLIMKMKMTVMNLKRKESINKEMGNKMMDILIMKTVKVKDQWIQCWIKKIKIQRKSLLKQLSQEQQSMTRSFKRKLFRFIKSSHKRTQNLTRNLLTTLLRKRPYQMCRSSSNLSNKDSQRNKFAKRQNQHLLRKCTFL